MLTRSFYLSIFFSIFILSVGNAQDVGPGSVTVYSEDGDKFTLYLNGEQKNASPASRVVVENVVEVPVAFRIVFEKAIPELKKKGFRGGNNCLYAIQKNKKGEYALKIKDCTGEAAVAETQVSVPVEQPVAPVATSTPAQLSATYANGVITINDGRTLSVKKVKANGMTYPRLIMNALAGSHVSIAYDNGNEKFSAESPMQYEVKDFTNNNGYLTLTVDEGGPEKTWHVKLQNSNGYDLKIE